MNKFKILGVVVLGLLLLSLVSCSGDDDGYTNYTFVSTEGSPTPLEFRVRDGGDYRFKVTFKQDEPLLELVQGDTVSGRLKNIKRSEELTGGAGNIEVEGLAHKWGSSNEGVLMILEYGGDIPVRMVFEYVQNKPISVEVEFPGDEGLSPIANALMGGTYIIKQ